ncbi:MAG: 1-deoxy-D-xylulose-5-phosphate synthase [Firmicutes bacterium]|nr:1-deoxy-D-xylulose-5-phosphate synthase [Bacillota bacterium]
MAQWLEKIKSPADLRGLSRDELYALAAEIRREIIKTTSQTGGHLAPSLGVVELTIALHCCYNSPKDKIIWDVGHQAYAHKLLTGRYDRFSTLRQLGGISGFPKREESPHDPFGTGHSSTSISAALGFAEARDMAGEDYEVVAVIGDGAMTGGMAFEALNHAGHLGTKLTVILNDNEMSIAPNVGALSNYLTRLRTDPTFRRAKNDLEYVLRRIPAIGETVVKAAQRLKDSLKYLLVPGMLFEELGFKYYGPIDGHNIDLLINTLNEVKTRQDPVLVHVLTEKGRGYRPAETDASAFHGLGPFDIRTGKKHKNNEKPRFTQAFSRALVELAKEDERIVAITAAMPSGTGLEEFARLFPGRFYDVGIAEQHATTFAAGLAAGGFKPVFAVYSTFLQRGYDQVVHDICLQNLPVVLAVDRGGLVGEDGPTHHGAFDLSFLRSIPNLVLMAPKDGRELRGMLRAAFRHQGPVALRYPRANCPDTLEDESWPRIEIGKGEVLADGSDLTLIAVGSMVQVAEEVAARLKPQGIEAAVLNARFVKPLDQDLILRYAAKSGKVVTLEESAVQGGFGSAVLELLANAGLTCPTLTLGIPDNFIPHGSRQELLELVGLTPERVLETVTSWLGHRWVSHG